jgi:tetratricopeptide (TPR) repeat protein
MGWELSQVKSAVMSNDQALTSELAKLLEQAEGLRCAYSNRLAYQPLRGSEGIIYEKRVLEEWMLTNKAWPDSSTPIKAPLAEVDREVKEQVKQFSLRALEVLQNCIRRDVRRKAAVALVAECLGVLNANSDLNEFVGVLQDCSREEQAAVLGSFKHFRHGLLRKLLMNVALMQNQYDLTLVLTEVLEEAQLNSKKVKAKDFISTLKRTWRESPDKWLRNRMKWVIVRLYHKINERQQVEYFLLEEKFARETGESKFRGVLDDLYLDLTFNEPALVSYEDTTNKSNDQPRSFKSSLLCSDWSPTEAGNHPDHSEQAKAHRVLGNRQLADLKDQAACYPPRTDRLSTSYYDLGSFLRDLKRLLEDLLDCLKKLLEALKALLSRLATIIEDQGTEFYNVQDYARAEDCYLVSLDICQEILPAKHPDLKTLYMKLEKLYRTTGDYARVEEFKRLTEKEG